MTTIRLQVLCYFASDILLAQIVNNWKQKISCKIDLFSSDKIEENSGKKLIAGIIKAKLWY